MINILEYFKDFLVDKITRKIYYNENPKFFPKKNGIYFVFDSTKIENKDIIIKEMNFSTAVINLKEGTDEIFSKFRKNTKKEIKKIEKEIKNKKIKIEFKINSNLDEIIKNFKNFYFKKYNKKKYIKNRYKKKHIKTKAFSIYFKNLFITGFVFLETKNKEFSRLLHSTNIRLLNNDNNITSNLIGNLTRYLHWMAIKYYKEKGFNYYDFGGISKKTGGNFKNIDFFKLSFGGNIIDKKIYVVTKNKLLKKIVEFYFKMKKNEKNKYKILGNSKICE
jgi:hypothetical protein